VRRPVGATTHAAIEAAIARLLNAADGKPLTIAQLAAEAGLSRATLYRAPTLVEKFRVAARQCDVVRTPQNSDRVHVLEAEVSILRCRENDEIRELRVINRNMAQHIQALSLLVRDREREVKRLQLELSECGRVVPLTADVLG
jgi:hypothetical protein